MMPMLKSSDPLHSVEQVELMLAYVVQVAVEAHIHWVHWLANSRMDSYGLVGIRVLDVERLAIEHG